MNNHTTYNRLLDLTAKGSSYVCLIDPDKTEPSQAAETAYKYCKNGADIIFVGGSLMMKDNFDLSLRKIKSAVDIPVIIFPGLFNFVSKHCDALLLLSMISSRNPQLLISEQVQAAPAICNLNVEPIGTGYILVDGGNNTSVQYMSQSLPVPCDKDDIALATALAGQYLGMKMIYLEAGSGARVPVSNSMIDKVKKHLEIPLIVGGGIRTPETAREKAEAGADFVVTGTVLEKNADPGLIRAFADAVHGA